MRVLVVSNLYPPHFVGGYELQARDIVEELQRREHRVRVVTSTFGVQRRMEEDDVLRALTFRWDVRPTVGDILSAGAAERRDGDLLAAELKRWRPDVVLVCNLLGLFRSLPLRLHQAGAKLLYGVCDHWYAEFGDGRAVFWRHRPTHPPKAWCKEMIRRWMSSRGLETLPHLPQAEHAFFASHDLRRRAVEAGQPCAGAPVIYPGKDLGSLLALPGGGPGNRILFIGRLHPNKGPQTLIEATGRLAARGVDVVVNLCGDGDRAFTASLRHQARKLNIERRVKFLGRRPQEAMPEVYAANGVFVFPSIWDEPFGLTRVEAMAAGLAVVTTMTGGSREIVTPGEDCLDFPPDDAAELAAALERLATDPELRRRLGANARATVRRRFTLERMVDAVEDELERRVSQP